MRACILTFLVGALLTGCSGGASPESQATTADPSEVTEVVIEGVCPISGEAIDEAVTVDYNGKTVKFCCTDCLAAWEKMSDEEKQAKLAAAAEKLTK